MGSFNDKEPDTASDFDWQESARLIDGMAEEVDAKQSAQYVEAVKALSSASGAAVVSEAAEAVAPIPLYRSKAGKARVWLHRNGVDFAFRWSLLLLNPVLAAACWLCTPKDAWLLHAASGATASPWWFLTLAAFGVLIISSVVFASYVLTGPYVQWAAAARSERLAEEDAVIRAALLMWHGSFLRYAEEKKEADLDPARVRALTAMQVDLLNGIQFHLSLLPTDLRPAGITELLRNNRSLLRRRPKAPGTNPLFTAR